jgi:hypothetical protein
MFWADHPPPPFHAIYGEYEALIEIQTSEIIEGSLPLGAKSLVSQWVALHRSEILEQWNLARQSQPFSKIDPLP